MAWAAGFWCRRPERGLVASGFSGPYGPSWKIEKRSFFGIKNVKNFESGIHIFFLKIFSTQKGTLH